MRKGGFVILALCLFASAAQADALTGGIEAKRLLGDLKRHFAKQSYSVLILERHDRQPIHLEPIDAILFNPGGGSFEKIRIRDRNHRLILNSPVGSRGEELTPDLLKRLLGLIERNHMVPYVLKDVEGRERMVVFTDPYNVCNAHKSSKGIFVSIESHPFRRSKTLVEESPVWFRKY